VFELVRLLLCTFRTWEAGQTRSRG